MRLEENVCLTTPFNAFNNKMAYILRDKDPRTLRDAFRMAMNIENNRKASRKLGRRDDPNLFSPRRNKKEGDKSLANKKPKEDKVDQMLTIFKNMNPQVGNDHKENTADKP